MAEASVVDHHVDHAQLAFHGVEECVDGAGIGDVKHVGESSPPCLLNLTCGFLEALETASPHGDVPAQFAEGFRDGDAEPRGSSGDDGGATLLFRLWDGFAHESPYQ